MTGIECVSVCPDCGRGFDTSWVTDCKLNMHGLREGQALIRMGAHGEPGIHMHGVVVAAADALTVRASVHRWAQVAWARSRYRVKRLTKKRLHHGEVGP